MINMGVRCLHYTSYKDLNNCGIHFKDGRIMDDFSKMTVATAKALYEKALGSEIKPHRFGIVLATKTGNYDSVRGFHKVLSKDGASAINPSLFPNVMLSTPLCYVAKELKATGFTIPLFIDKGYDQALRIAAVVFKLDKCDAIIVLYTEEKQKCFGLFLESEEFLLKREKNARFYISTNIN